MKKTSKILVALCIILMIVGISIVSYGTTPAEILSGLDGKASVSGASTVKTFGNNMVTIVRVVGTVIAVIVLLILGIKYMMGSAEEKADYKKTMIPYIVGAVLIFAATQIVGIVLDLSAAVTQ